MQKQRLISIIVVGVVFVIAAVLILILLDVIPGRKPSRIPKTTLEIWGVFNDRKIFEDMVEEFTSQDFYKNVTIKYQEKFIDEYEDELLNAFSEGRGPDIFMVHNTWLPKHESKIDPWPQDETLFKGSLLGAMSARDFQITFVDVCYKDFVTGQKVFALPLYVDTLALFYNKDMFNTAGIPEPPTTWEEFEDTALALTRYDESGEIVRSGIPLGSANNINRSTDILSLLFLQNDILVIDTTSGVPEPALARWDSEQVLDFYTGFAKKGSPNYTWNPEGKYSIDSFYQGEAAMMINYSHHIDTLLEKNVYFRFDVASIPQVEGSEKDISYANYWGLAVTKNPQNNRNLKDNIDHSSRKRVAHEFIRWMSQKEVMQRYVELTKRPTARRDLVLWQGTSYPDLNVFSRQALQAESWYQPDQRRVDAIFKNMIESVVEGELSIREALQRAEEEMRLLLR